MPEAVLAASATVGFEAVSFAFAAEGAAWSWGTVLAKSAFSFSVDMIGKPLTSMMPAS